MQLFTTFFSPVFHFFIKDKLIFLTAIAGFLVNLASWFILFWQIKPGSGNLLLHYTVYFGVDWVGEWYKIFTAPLVGLLILVLNFFLAFFIYQKQRIISYLLLLSSLFVEIVVGLYAIFLIIMNV